MTASSSADVTPECGVTSAPFAVAALDEVSSRYEGALLQRLAQTAARFAAEPANDQVFERFRQNWMRFRALPLHTLLAAARYPLVDSWTKVADHLLRLDIPRRYPLAHPRRVAQDFSRIFLSLSSLMPGETEGVLSLLGRTSIPLFGGEVLLTRERPIEGEVHWRCSPSGLELELAGVGLLATFDTKDPKDGGSVHQAGWDVRVLKNVRGIIVDLWSSEYTGNSSPAQNVSREADYLHALERLAVQRIPGADIVFSDLRCVSEIQSRSRWIAGVAVMSPGISPEAIDQELLRQGFQDRIQRLMNIGELPLLDRRGSGLVSDASAWLAARVSGGPQVPGPPDVLAWLCSTSAGVALLQRLGLGSGVVTRMPESRAEANTLHLGETRVFSTLDVAIKKRLRIVKSRRNAPAVDDWSIFRHLATLAEGTLERLQASVIPVFDGTETEPEAFAAAVLAYLSGNYPLCKTALERCLALDSSCEEYWHLLAFTLRYLRDDAGFESIVFNGCRVLSVREIAQRKPVRQNPARGAALPASESIPYSFHGVLRDIVHARGRARHVTQYVAVTAGIRRSLDDWIPSERFDGYEGLMNKLGLVVRPDCVFEPLMNQTIQGIEHAPTTRATGRPWTGKQDLEHGESVHVILSSRGDWADEALAAAWYPLAIEDRILKKPLVDHQRLGYAFGYPKCCVDFFLRHNDWPRQNTLAEAARASRSFHWETNCLAKSTIWMLIFHMPCAFDCPHTIRYSRSLLEAVRESDPRYADAIHRSLKQTVLSINERTAFALTDAEPNGSRVRYRAVVNLRQEAVQESWEETEGRTLANGDEIRIEDGIVFVLRQGELTGTIETRCDHGVAEVPIVLTFE